MQEPTSTADPCWDRLLSAVASPGQGAGCTPTLPGVFFDPARLGRCAGAVPASAVSALLKGLKNPGAHMALRGMYVRAAAHLAMVLADQGAGAGAHAPTPSKARAFLP